MVALRGSRFVCFTSYVWVFGFPLSHLVVSNLFFVLPRVIIYSLFLISEHLIHLLFLCLNSDPSNFCCSPTAGPTALRFCLEFLAVPAPRAELFDSLFSLFVLCICCCVLYIYRLLLHLKVYWLALSLFIFQLECCCPPFPLPYVVCCCPPSNSLF